MNENQEATAPVFKSVLIAPAGFDILTMGMISREETRENGEWLHKRTATIEPDDTFFVLRVSFELCRRPSKESEIEQRILWLSAIQKYNIKFKSEEGEIALTSNTADKIKLPGELLINLMQNTHVSMRGAIAMLVRGTWMAQFVPFPETLRTLMQLDEADKIISEAAEQIFV